jgi:hypothetical protein
MVMTRGGSLSLAVVDTMFTAAFALTREVFLFINSTFPFPPRVVDSPISGLNKGDKRSGEAPSPDSDLGFYNFCQNRCSLARQKL